MTTHPSILCNDVNCTMKDSCARFLVGKAKRFYKGYKQWNNECSFHLRKDSAQMTEEEKIESQRDEFHELRSMIGR